MPKQYFAARAAKERVVCFKFKIENFKSVYSQQTLRPWFRNAEQRQFRILGDENLKFILKLLKCISNLLQNKLLPGRIPAKFEKCQLSRIGGFWTIVLWTLQAYFLLWLAVLVVVWDGKRHFVWPLAGGYAGRSWKNKHHPIGSSSLSYR